MLKQYCLHAHAFGVLLSIEKCDYKTQCKQDETCTLFQTKNPNLVIGPKVVTKVLKAGP